MGKGISIRLSGVRVAETVKCLAQRLAELGQPVEVFDDARAERLGGPAAARACAVLSRNGVVVLAAYSGPRPEGDCLEAEVAAYDTPEFAAEKLLDELARAGVISLEAAEYSSEEEELVRKRLADLGYVE